MYKAIKNIGGYKIGDIVPDEKAEHWLEMFDVIPHVEKVDEVVEPVKPGATEEKSEEVTKPKSSMNDLLDDYLGRNQSVVRKNVSEDKLNENQLKELLKLEKADKNRPLVINAIEERLKKNSS